MEKDCVFCKIVAGVKDDEKVWENEEFLAVLDINPCARGHLLVIPKKHSRWIWDMEKGEYLRYMDKIFYLANILRKSFETDCIQMAVAGVDVIHSHVHLLPRVEGDELGGIPVTPMEPKPSGEEMKKIGDKIKNFI